MKNRIERVEIEYCKNEKCLGHKGPNNLHGHVNLYREGVSDPIKSPAFGSRKAGTALALIMNEATASDEERLTSSLISQAVASADLPETYGDDDRFVEANKAAQNIALPFDMILIFDDGEDHDPDRLRLIEHKQYTVALVGCLSCGAIMALYNNDLLVARADGIRNVDEAKRVLDQATERLKISTEDDAAMREQLGKLFAA